jgi:hypothetical protein
VALKIGEQVDDVGLSLWRSGGALGRGLQQQRLPDVGVEQMFRSGEARGVFDRVGETGDMEDYGVGGFFGTEAVTGLEAAFAERAGETQNSRDGLNIFLLLVG